MGKFTFTDVFSKNYTTKTAYQYIFDNEELNEKLFKKLDRLYNKLKAGELEIEFHFKTKSQRVEESRILTLKKTNANDFLKDLENAQCTTMMSADAQVEKNIASEIKEFIKEEYNKLFGDRFKVFKVKC